MSSSLAACQRAGGAFLRTNTAKVLSCVQTPAAPVDKAAKKPKAAAPSAGSSSSAPAGPTFDVQLSDTILFPEGGGQPTDTGVLELAGGESVRVLAVSRTPGGVVHRVERAVPVDAEVTVNVDWARRFDHMQCHSSQHLISAVARSQFGFKTLSWWLASAPQECHIELDTGAAGMSAEQMTQLEAMVNEWIRRGAAMKLHTFESLAAARADPFFTANIQKAIPDDQPGAIRVIEIDGLEFNPCCGTHLESTSQLQAVKLTRVEKGKTSSKLFFLTGDRTLAALQSSLDIQRALTASLCCAPEQFPEQVRRMQADLKASNKQLAAALKELAEVDAARLVASLQQAGAVRVAQLHRDEVGLGYIGDVADLVQTQLKAANSDAPFLLLLSTADAVGSAAGAFLLVGDEGKVTALGAELATKLQGKGGGRKGKFQGKASGLDARSRADAFAWLQTSL